MADRIKGITIEIGGDTTGLNNALSDTNKEIKNTQSQLKDVDRLLKLDPSNTELLSQKQKLLSQAVEGTKDKLDTLKAAESQAQQQFKEGKISQEQYDGLKREIIATEQQLKALEEQAGKSNVALQQIAEAGKKVDEFGGKVTGAGQKMSGVTAAISGVAAASVAAWNTIDDAYDTIAKGTGATGDALEGLQKSFDNVFASIPTDAATAGSAIADINTRFGFTGEVLEDCTAKFIQFGEVNNTDVSAAIANVSRYMGDAGIESSKYAEVLDQLTAASQGSGLSVDKLSDTLTKYGAPMRALGFDTKESIAIFSSWEKAGVNTEIAFSGMKKAIGTWGKEGKDAREEFKKTLKEIEECPDIASATSKAIEVFGQKAGPDLADAIQGGRFAYEDFLNIVNNSSGQLEQTFNDTLDPVDEVKVAMQGLTSAGAELGGSILEVVSPMLTQLIGLVKQAGTWFRGLSDSQKQIIVIIGLIVAAIGPLLMILGTIISSLGAVMTAVAGISIPVVAVVAAIGALIAVFVHLYQTNEEFRGHVQEVWEQIKEFILLAVETIQQLITAFVETGKALWEKYGSGVTEIVTNAFEFIKNVIDGALTFISDLINVVTAVINGDWEGAWKAMLTLVSNVAENIKKIVGSWIEVVKSTIKLGLQVASDLFSKFRDFAVDIFMGLKDKIAEKVVQIKDTIVEGIGKAVDWIKSLPSQALEWGKDFIQGLIDGIASKIGDIKNSIKGVAETIASMIHFTRPDTGPLRYYETWMPDMMKGLSHGIKDNVWRITDQLNSMTGKMASLMTGDMSFEGKGADLSTIENLLNYYLPNLNGGTNIVLDDGTLVGKMMPAINTDLSGSRDTRGRNGA